MKCRLRAVFTTVVPRGTHQHPEPSHRIATAFEEVNMAIAGAHKEPIPAPVRDEIMPESGWDADQRESAVFAGGCFWGVQSVFQRVKGVENTTVGYSGGARHTADYRTVSSGTNGHAQAIEIGYYHAKVSYGTLVRIFFSVVHDPTQMNRQGNDIGTQYRSAIFYTDEEQ